MDGAAVLRNGEDGRGRSEAGRPYIEVLVGKALSLFRDADLGWGSFRNSKTITHVNMDHTSPDIQATSFR